MRTFSIPVIIAAALCVALSGCFSPWAGGTANITINLGPEEAGRVLVDAKNEMPRMEHIITLKGPSGTISRKVSGGSVSFEVGPGRWKIDVRAIGDRPDVFPGHSILGSPVFPARMLRAIGLASVDVKGGENAAVPIKMTTATEADNWDKVIFLMGNADPSGEEIIVLTANMTTNAKATLGRYESPNSIPVNVTLMSDRDITVKRGGVHASAPILEILHGSTLALGKAGMAGTIAIDGSKELGMAISSSLINLDNGTLRMHHGIALKNNIVSASISNTGGAVTVDASGVPSQFYMQGGIIAGNESSNGGGVLIKAGASFIMTGGTIEGNTASNQGGAVAVQGGSFDMAGSAAIRRNEAANGGGGVVLNYTIPNAAVFTMRGGSISNNTVVSNLTGGGGVLINFGSFFTMNGGAITGNKAPESNGGGVYFKNNSASGSSNPFSMEGGSISGNESISGGGVYLNDNAKLDMTGGSISGNTAAQFGGGVMADNQSNFEMSGGTIGSSNSAINGGGVYLNEGSALTMGSGASIIGNTAASDGGGLYLSSVRYNGVFPSIPNMFTMEGGAIGGNTAGGNGAGIFSVSFPSGGNFINRVDKMEEGLIYGNDAGNNSNRAGNANKSGHAAYYQYGLNAGDFIYRDTTVNHTDQLWAYGQHVDGNIGWDEP